MNFSSSPHGVMGSFWAESIVLGNSMFPLGITQVSFSFFFSFFCVCVCVFGGKVRNGYGVVGAPMAGF